MTKEVEAFDAERASDAVESIARHAIAGTEPKQIGDLDLYVVTAPAGGASEVVDVESMVAKHRPTPVRHKGTTKLEEESSFSEFVKSMNSPNARIYGSNGRFVAVFNDAAADAPGWADHLAILDLQETPEWKHWMSQDGRMLTQEAFAEHLEDGSLEIREPAAAEMLELAQSFHAKNSVNFRQASVLPSGERKFVYEETLDATAGTRGDLVIPAEFQLAIAPFEGSEPYKVLARLRYRLRESKLTLGYKLERPDAILRDAFTGVGNMIQSQTDVPVLAGHPPTGV